MRHSPKFLPFVVILTLFCIISNICTSQGVNMVKQVSFNPSFSYSACWGYVAPNGREYAILGAVDGTYFYEIRRDRISNFIGFVPTGGSPSDFGNQWREMKTFSHYAYIVSEADTSGVQIVDLQYLPDSVHYVGKYFAPGHSSTHTISQSGPYLYLNGGNFDFGNGTSILDLSGNPELPVLRGKWTERYVHDSRPLNDTIWAANISDGYLSVIDASNKDSLRTIASWQTLPNPFTHNCALTTDRKYIYTTDETLNPPGRLKIWNIEDLNNVLSLGAWEPPGFPNSVVHNIEIYDTLAVIAHYSAGVRVLNISKPDSPREIAWYDTYPDNNATNYEGCWGVYMFPSGLIIGSDRKYGLFVLDPILNSQPAAPNAEFTAISTTLEVGRSIDMIDLTSGYPDSWEWTVTGNEIFNSTLQNPSFTFSQIGQYTVKLKVSNSFGADSIVKPDYINVVPPILNPFAFTVTGIQTLLTSPNDTNKVTYYWTKSSALSGITYRFKAQKFGGSDFRWLSSNLNGTDTSITFTKSYLDSMAREFGLNGDSLLITCRAYAYNGFDSLATGNSLILNIKTNTVGINIISSEIPGEFKLDNNYPNPFNPETNIQYQLPKAAFVTIKLYDIMGREVRTLVNEKHDAGYYNYRFNANGLSSGVYFYKIQAGDFSDIKRMMLIK